MGRGDEARRKAQAAARNEQRHRNWLIRMRERGIIPADPGDNNEERRTA